MGIVELGIVEPEFKTGPVAGIVRVSKQQRPIEARVHPSSQTHRLDRKQEVLNEKVCLDLNSECPQHA